MSASKLNKNVNDKTAEEIFAEQDEIVKGNFRKCYS